MNVDDVYRIMRFIARKNQLESLSPTEFQDSFNTAQRNYYDFLVGRIEQYRYDKPIPRVGLAMTDNISSRLIPFQVNVQLSITSGQAVKPNGLNKLVSMSTPNDYRVYRVEQDRLQERIKDSIDPINEENAFYTEYREGWNIYPSSLAYVNIVYLEVPENVVWGYTLDGSGRPVYNPSTSTNPAWLDNDIDEIIGRALRILGVSIKESALVNFGQQVITQGE